MPTYQIRAKELTIECPSIAVPAKVSRKYHGCPSAIKVEPSSPIKLHKPVFQIARYMMEEFEYNLQYSNPDYGTDLDACAYLFPHPECITIEPHWYTTFVGACCFRWKDFNKNQDPYWVLQWIWMHPYLRRKGILSRQWGHFQEEFKDFRIEYPLSYAMREFLIKRDPAKLSH